jgi:hypothetical protein
MREKQPTDEVAEYCCLLSFLKNVRCAINNHCAKKQAKCLKKQLS